MDHRELAGNAIAAPDQLPLTANHSLLDLASTDPDKPISEKDIPDITDIEW